MSETTTSLETDQAAACGCGHQLDQHDRIALRFCEATVAGVLPRACICAKVKPPPPRVRHVSL